MLVFGHDDRKDIDEKTEDDSQAYADPGADPARGVNKR